MRKLALALAALLSAGWVGYGAHRLLLYDSRYDALVTLGDELIAKEMPFQATRTYSAAISLRPGSAIAYVKRAEALRKQANFAPAIDDLERAATLTPDVHLVSMRLAELYDEAGRFDDAAHHYQNVLAVDPGAADIWYALGLVYFRGGREAESIAALNRAAELRAGFWEAYYLRGAVFRALGGRDEAEADLKKALELAPDAAPARLALMALYIENRDPARAMPLVQQEVNANPGAALPYLHLAEVHRLAGHAPEAIEAVGLALEQDPNLPAAYLELGELWLDEATGRGDAIALEKAVTALDSVVKMEPGNGAACLALGRAHLAMGDEVRAFSELKRAGEATPPQAEAHRLLGDLYRARANYAEAVTAYHIYLLLEGQSPPVLERLGDTYLDLEKPGLAAETYLELAELEPHRVGPLAKAASAFLLHGNAESAATVCRRGLAANPENATLLELLARAERRRPFAG